jgi:hypothetical protein
MGRRGRPRRKRQSPLGFSAVTSPNCSSIYKYFKSGMRLAPVQGLRLNQLPYKKKGHSKAAQV